jgi:hypothetical protein
LSQGGNCKGRDYSKSFRKMLQNDPCLNFGPWGFTDLFWGKCKHGSFCSIFHRLSEYCNLELPFGANRGYWWLKKKQIFAKNLRFFDQKWTPTMPKLCLSHHSWIFMISIIRKRVIMSNINNNDLIIQFFLFSAIFQ